jgi:hypothetical protein
MNTQQQPDQPVDQVDDVDDLGPLFTTPQISTDDAGVHTDDAGREHQLVDVDGEATFVPVLEDAPTEADATARVLIDVQVDLVRTALEAAFDLGLIARAVQVSEGEVKAHLYRTPADAATLGQGQSWLSAMGARDHVAKNYPAGDDCHGFGITHGYLAHPTAGSIRVLAFVRPFSED